MYNGGGGGSSGAPAGRMALPTLQLLCAEESMRVAATQSRADG